MKKYYCDKCKVEIPANEVFEFKKLVIEYAEPYTDSVIFEHFCIKCKKSFAEWVRNND